MQARLANRAATATAALTTQSTLLEAGQAPLETLHWVSHGQPGVLMVAEQRIDQGALLAHQELIATWGVSDLGGIWRSFRLPAASRTASLRKATRAKPPKLRTSTPSPHRQAKRQYQTEQGHQGRALASPRPRLRELMPHSVPKVAAELKPNFR